jgi:soluble P-type ATPase
MIDVTIPGFGRLELSELVCDFNGTLARDGRLLNHARTLLPKLAGILTIRVVTGDTFGSARAELRGCACELSVLGPQGQAQAKVDLVDRLGAGRVVAIGNGRNDRLMLARAALGIGVMGDEGIASEAVAACDIVARQTVDALELLIEPGRLIATLRD